MRRRAPVTRREQPRCGGTSSRRVNAASRSFSARSCNSRCVEELLELAAGLPTRALTPDERLIDDGDTSDTLYVLLEGALRVEKAGVSITTISEPGACIGEMSLLLGRPATTDVVAIEPTVVAVASDARRRIAEDPTITLL